MLGEKKWRTDTLDALLSDTKNRASKPLETLNTQLALYITDVTNEADEGEEDEPVKQRGAERDVLNAPMYQKMLKVVNERIDSYATEKTKSKRNVSQIPVYRNELDLSPLRLLTEHRRKLLLKSLCGFNDVEEHRDSATVGIENSFNLRECEVPALPEEMVTKYFPSKNNAHTETLPSSLSPSPLPKALPKKEKKFVPKWDHYDVMQHRWISLQPATKRLVVAVEDYIPTSSVHNSIAVDCMDEPIQGRFLDSVHFDQTVQSIEASKASRGTRTRSSSNKSLTRGSMSRGEVSIASSRKSCRSMK